MVPLDVSVENPQGIFPKIPGAFSENPQGIFRKAEITLQRNIFHLLSMKWRSFKRMRMGCGYGERSDI